MPEKFPTTHKAVVEKSKAEKQQPQLLREKQENIKKEIDAIFLDLQTDWPRAINKMRASKINKEEFLKPAIQLRLKRILDVNIISYVGSLKHILFIIEDFPIDKNILTQIFEKRLNQWLLFSSGDFVYQYEGI